MPLLLFVVGCGDELRPPIIAESEHLILRAPLDTTVCGGTFAKMEADVIAVRSVFTATWGPVDYAWLPSSHYGPDEFPCSLTDYACAPGTRVYARTLASTHEIVHAAREGLPWVLEEGTASVLSPADFVTVDVLGPREELWAALELDWSEAKLTIGLYERAAHFVSYLIASGGMERFAAFGDRARALDRTYGSRIKDWRGAFEDVYDLPFEAIVAGYEDYPDCPPPQFHRPVADCAGLLEGAPEAILNPGILGAPSSNAIFERQFECEQEDVHGPIVRGRRLSRASLHRIEIEVPLVPYAWLSLRGDTAPASRALLTNCGNCWDGVGALVTHHSPAAFINVDPGRYLLVLEQAMEKAGPVGIELSP